MPVNRFGDRKFLGLFRQPADSSGAGLRIVVQTQDERADFFVAAAAVNLDQGLDCVGKLIFAGVVRLKLFVQRFVGELAGFAFVEDGELRVEAEFVKMLAHEAQAKTVERADVGDVEECKLARPVVVVRRGGGFNLEFATETLAQLGGGGLGEGDDKQFVERRVCAVEAVEAAGDEQSWFCRCRHRP